MQIAKSIKSLFVFTFLIATLGGPIAADEAKSPHSSNESREELIGLPMIELLAKIGKETPAANPCNDISSITKFWLKKACGPLKDHELCHKPCETICELAKRICTDSKCGPPVPPQFKKVCKAGCTFYSEKTCMEYCACAKEICKKPCEKK